MPVEPSVPPRLRGKTFRGSRAVALGLLTANQLRSSAWRPLFRDVYVDARVEVTHRLRARAAAGLLVPDSVVSGTSAAVLWGVDLAGPDDDVELTLPAGAHARRHPGVRVRRARLDPADVRRRSGTRLTSPVATAVRVAGVLPEDDAASARVRAVCSLADGRAESPQETTLRLLMRRARLPEPEAQFEVWHDGRFVARVDFGWPEHKVAVEYDGLWHADDRQFAKDRRRLNRLREAGWTVVFVTAADLHDPLRLLATIRSAVRR